MQDIPKIFAILMLYGLVFFVVWHARPALDRAERKTYWILAAFWGITIFFVNYLGYLMGILGFLPWWPNNALHAFVWVGLCLPYMFLAIRKEHPVIQFMAYSGFSLVIRYAEYNLFGVWDFGHLLYLFPGTDAYIIGWSFFDGGFGIATTFLLRRFGPHIGGFIDTTETKRRESSPAVLAPHRE
jgi:hypothetical protein